MKFKDRFRELRQKNNVSAQDIAKTLGKSESAIRMWETGKSKPDADTLIKLSEYFDCTADYLLGTSEFKNQKEKSENVFTEKLLLENLGKLTEQDRIYFLVCLNDSLGHIFRYIQPGEEGSYGAVREMGDLVGRYGKSIQKALEYIHYLNHPEYLEKAINFPVTAETFKPAYCFVLNASLEIAKLRDVSIEVLEQHYNSLMRTVMEETLGDSELTNLLIDNIEAAGKYKQHK